MSTESGGRWCGGGAVTLNTATEDLTEYFLQEVRPALQRSFLTATLGFGGTPKMYFEKSLFHETQ